MKQTSIFFTVAAAGIFILSCQQSGGKSAPGDSTALQTATEATPAAPVKYLKKFTRTLTDDEPEVFTLQYDAQHRLIALDKEGDPEGGQQLEYDAQGRIARLTYHHDGRKHVIAYTYAGNSATGKEVAYDGEDASGEITWTFALSNGKVTDIKKENKEEPSENSHQVYRYNGDNLTYVASMAPNGKDTAGVSTLTYGKKASPFAGARLPLMHPTALFLLQSANDMTSMTLRNKSVNMSVTTTYEYKYDAQGYPVSGVEKDGGDVSATSTYQYE